MRAHRRFTVRTRLPQPLMPLGELVMNLRWSWHAPTQDLLAQVDPDVWAAVGHDPVRLLGEVSAERMAALAHDGAFLRRLNEEHADLQRYLTEPRWYQSLEDAPTTIAYFSPEYGISQVLPQYSGGLGILAGDHLKTASDLGVPIVGVGLLYRRGYFQQSLSPDGWQLEHYPAVDPHGLPLTLLQGEDGSPLRVELPLPDGALLRAQVWRAQVGRVPLLLLDSDVEGNSATEREITDRLYGGGSDHRLLQELLLGVGGVRALVAFGAQPEVFHTNEGHAGFLGVERIRMLMADGASFDTALEAVRAGTVFTTHTPVPAGIDRFPAELVEKVLVAGVLGDVPVDRVLALGREPDGDGTVFNMAFMGLRLAQRANGVSRLHGEVSREMFAGLWPGFEPAEVPIRHVTNGVHAPTWVARPVMDLARREVGSDLTEMAQGWEGVEGISDADVWSVKRGLRAELVEEIRRRVRRSWQQRGAAPAELGWTESIFDPDVLTIGFARRVPSYKRLTLVLRDQERLRRLLLDSDRPIQLVVAGKAHPADDGGKALVQQLVRFADDPSVRDRMAFLPDYDMAMARALYAGCDVWLNNPLRPLEACGTSGMKAALNGALNLSIRDGWWDELYDGSNGWAIPTADGVDDPERRDDLESIAVYDLLERSVVPAFYERDGDGTPPRWCEMVRHTLQSLGPAILASRMVRDYVVDLYAPAARSSRAMSADGLARAGELAAWRTTVAQAWPHVSVRHVESGGIGDAPELGSVLTVRAVVCLGGLSPDDVEVRVAWGRVDEADRLLAPQEQSMKLASSGDGDAVYEAEVPLERTGPFGYTVRVVAGHPALVSPAESGLVVTA